jgi:hypothetical protein
MTERPPKLTETDIAKLAATVQAPESLHRRVREMAAADRGSMGSPIGQQRRKPARRRMGWAMPAGLRAPGLAVAGATALAATVGVVLAVTLSGGGGGRALTPQAAATLALGPATRPAPAESVSNRGELTASVDGVAFPYWEERFGWRGSGARSDALGGRAVTTVFYSNARGQRIGYAIVAGAAPATADGTVVRRWGVAYRLSSQDGASVIAWLRGGHLCVMAGRGVSPSTLLSLASWDSVRAHAA